MLDLEASINMLAIIKDNAQFGSLMNTLEGVPSR